MDEKKLKKIKRAIVDGEAGLLEHIMEVEEEMAKMHEVHRKEMAALKEEMKRAMPDMKDVLEQIKGKDGKDGESITGPQGPRGPKGDPGKSIVGPRGPAGTNGKDSTVPGPVGPRGPAGKDADEEAILTRLEEKLPAAGERIRDSLELLQGEERLSAKAIKDLDKILDRVTSLERRPVGGAIAGRDVFQDIDISSQFDGVVKTFNIPGVWRIISVDLSSYPYGAMQKTSDYTWTPTSITFGDSIDAGTQLSVGQKCILTVVTA